MLFVVEGTKHILRLVQLVGENKGFVRVRDLDIDLPVGVVVSALHCNAQGRVFDSHQEQDICGMRKGICFVSGC